MAGKYGLVLSDDLLVEFYKFKEHTDYDKRTIQRLLHYYKIGFLTNIAQLERTKVEVPANLKSQLRHAGFKRQTLEELAGSTIFKVVLSSDRSEFPYVNIYDDKIENNFSGTFYSNESRAKAIAHIQALCGKAKEIYIYDTYFSHVQGMYNFNTLCSILPRHALTIRYMVSHISEEDILLLSRQYEGWKFVAEDRMKTYHDRYLLIDGTMEVILTSGFEHLGRTEKDFSYVIRQISENHLRMQ